MIMMMTIQYIQLLLRTHHCTSCGFGVDFYFFLYLVSYCLFFVPRDVGLCFSSPWFKDPQIDSVIFCIWLITGRTEHRLSAGHRVKIRSIRSQRARLGAIWERKRRREWERNNTRRGLGEGLALGIHWERLSSLHFWNHYTLIANGAVTMVSVL